MYINWDYVINLTDRDEPNAQGKHPGKQYALRRAMLLDSPSKVVINTLVPKPHKDICDMANAVGMATVIEFINDTLDHGRSFEDD